MSNPRPRHGRAELPFPAVDRILYDDPPPELKRVLHHLRDGSVDGVLRATCDEHPLEPSFEHARARLTTLAKKGRYCFRGQTTRYIARYAGGAAAGGRNDLAVECDSLIPSGLRKGFLTRQPSRPGLDHLRPAVHAMLADPNHPWRPLLADHVRALVSRHDVFLEFRKLAASGVNVGVGGHQALQILMLPPTLLRLISLAQHYEFPSTMIDFTSDIEVALWFASHTWEGEPVQEGIGYVYCVDLDRSSAAIARTFSEGAIGDEPGRRLSRLLNAGLWGVADISDMDERFGLRPRRQAGLSFFGLEASAIMALMMREDAIRLVPIPLDLDAVAALRPNRTYLCPSEPILEQLGGVRRRDDWSPVDHVELCEACEIGESDASFLQTLVELGLV